MSNALQNIQLFKDINAQTLKHIAEALMLCAQHPEIFKGVRMIKIIEMFSLESEEYMTKISQILPDYQAS